MTSMLLTFEQLQIGTTFRALLLILIGIILARLTSSGLTRLLDGRLTRQQAMLLRRFTYYLVLFLFIASAIQQLGFHITALLGATGILTVALGIASQTSMSNIVSGIFIIGEKPFEVGDTIKVNDVKGEVVSIDLLSAKIRTSDNVMIRIPNETLVKSAITNISFYPNRRIDILLGLAYKENLDQVKTILFNSVKKNTSCLQEPAPGFYILNLGDSSVQIQFSVWTVTPQYDAVKSSLLADIKNAFAEHHIDMPFPTYSLYASRDTEPLPIKIVS